MPCPWRFGQIFLVLGMLSNVDFHPGHLVCFCYVRRLDPIKNAREDVDFPSLSPCRPPPLLLASCASVLVRRLCAQPGAPRRLLLAVRSVSPAPGEACICPVHIPQARGLGRDCWGLSLPVGVHTKAPCSPGRPPPQPWAVCGTGLSGHSGGPCGAPTAFCRDPPAPGPS